MGFGGGACITHNTFMRMAHYPTLVLCTSTLKYYVIEIELVTLYLSSIEEKVDYQLV